MPRPVSEPITKIACVTQRHHASAAAPSGGAGHGLTADALACTVDDRKMGSVTVGFQYVERLGADLHWFTSAIHMVIVIGGFDEGSCEQGEMSLPEAGRV